MNEKKPSAALSVLKLIVSAVFAVVIGILIPAEFIAVMRYTVRGDASIVGTGVGDMLEIAGGRVDPLFPIILGGAGILLLLAMLLLINRGGAERFFGSLGAVFAVAGVAFGAVYLFMPLYVSKSTGAFRDMIAPVSPLAVGIAPLMALGALVIGAFLISVSRIIAAVKGRNNK